MKLWKVTVKTYYFGTSHYILLVVAGSKEEAIQEVYKYPKYNTFDKISLTNSTL